MGLCEASEYMRRGVYVCTCCMDFTIDYYMLWIVASEMLGHSCKRDQVVYSQKW